MKGKMKGSMLYLIIVGILLVAILFGANQNFVSQKQQLNLGDFITNLSSGNIAKMDVELASDGSTAYVSFKLKDQGKCSIRRNCTDGSKCIL